MNNLYHYNTPGIARGVCWAFVASVRNAVVSEKQSSQTSILPKHLMQECSFELLLDKNRKLCHPTKVVECARNFHGIDMINMSTSYSRRRPTGPALSEANTAITPCCI